MSYKSDNCNTLFPRLFKPAHFRLNIIINNVVFAHELNFFCVKIVTTGAASIRLWTPNLRVSTLIVPLTSAGLTSGSTPIDEKAI